MDGLSIVLIVIFVIIVIIALINDGNKYDTREDFYEGEDFSFEKEARGIIDETKKNTIRKKCPKFGEHLFKINAILIEWSNGCLFGLKDEELKDEINRFNIISYLLGSFYYACAKAIKSDFNKGDVEFNFLATTLIMVSIANRKHMTYSLPIKNIELGKEINGVLNIFNDMRAINEKSGGSVPANINIFLYNKGYSDINEWFSGPNYKEDVILEPEGRLLVYLQKPERYEKDQLASKII